MKDDWLIPVILCLSLLIMIGCATPALPTATETLPTLLPGEGELAVRWGAESTLSERSILDADHSSALADCYELVLLSATETKDYVLESGRSNILAVPVGSYRAVILAGVHRSSTSSTVFLVGSASQDNVTVSEGARTSLDLTLKAVDFELSSQGTAIWYSQVQLKATGKTRNPMVGMFLDGTSTDRHPRFKSVEFWNGYKDPATVSGTPNDWQVEQSGRVPGNGSEVLVQFIGCGLGVLGLDSIWKPCTGLTQYAWEWLNVADMTDQHPLFPLGNLRLTTTAPATGVSLNLAWELP